MKHNLKKAIDMISKWEGLRLKAYLDPVKIWTIGYGTTYYPDGKKVKKGDVITKEQARDFLLDHVEDDVVPALDRLIKVDLNENQYNALVSFVYNIGVGAFTLSTMLQKLNANDIFGAAKEFPRWNKGTINKIKQVIPGLTNRRSDERKLFESPVEGAVVDEKDSTLMSIIKSIIEKIVDWFFAPKDSGSSVAEEILKRNKLINKDALIEALKWKDDSRILNKDYIFLVDMTMYDYEKRGHLINMRDYSSLSTLCAHGKKSDPDQDDKATEFSNVSGSNKSSLGAMRIGERYSSSKKKTGSKAAFRISRRIDGLEVGKNDKVRERAIVWHDAFYVTLERARTKSVGDSLGCFVLPYEFMEEHDSKVENILLYNYYKQKGDYNDHTRKSI